MIAEPANLDFRQHDTLRGTHGLHAFAAKCAPPLAAWAISAYSSRGECVLDPMAGSGTTLVEARLAGRHAEGVDIDPLATLIARVKATPLPLEPLHLACEQLLATVEQRCAEWHESFEATQDLDESAGRLQLILPCFHNRDYWFLPRVIGELAMVKQAIAALEPSPVREFLLVTFSSFIVARTSVANARDLVHSRHHHMDHAVTPDIPRLLLQRLRKMQSQMANFVQELAQDDGDITTRMERGDARHLSRASGTADLIFTSPPYCNALDYPRAHQFVVAWLAI